MEVTEDELHVSIKEFVTEETKILFGPAAYSQIVPF